MKLYLDDRRGIPMGYIGARDYEECIQLLEKHRGEITEMSLDHDLGELRTGYSVCKWIVENEYYENVEKIMFHSSNPVGVKNMLELIDKYAPGNIELYTLGINKEYVKFFRRY